MKNHNLLISYIILCLAPILLWSCEGKKAATETTGHQGFDIAVGLDGTQASAIQFGQELGMGWNLGNSFDCYVGELSGETLWNNDSVTAQAFDSVKAQGFRSVRIPITWLGHIGEAPDYTIEPAFLDRIAEVVEYAEKAQLYTIINIQHDGADSKHWLNFKEAASDSAANVRILEQYKAVWSQIAERFADKGTFLIFEALNEIHDGAWGWGDNMHDGGKQYNLLNSWMQEFVNTIRAASGNNKNRYLGIVGYCQDPERTCANLVMPDDPTPNRLLVGVHFYAPVQFTLSGEVDHFGQLAAENRSVAWCTERYLDIVFKMLHNTFVSNGIPVYIGETSCIHRENHRSEEFRLYYLEYVFKAAQDNGIPAFYWDNGNFGSGYEASGLIDHTTGKLMGNAAEVINVMRRAAYTHDDPNYTIGYLFEHSPRSY